MIQFARRRIVDPLKKFIHDSRAIGVILTLCAALSLLLANNGPWQNWYRHTWTLLFDSAGGHHINMGLFSFPNSSALVINDGLMAIFFFLVGMEIKREFLQGELASVKKATLPAFAALGGMIVPALLFCLFNKTASLRGWAIPTATDIAFTIGVASLLGKRIPAALKIFITALAIIDDLLAIIIIAFFYGEELHLWYLAASTGIMLLLWLLNRIKVAFGIWHWLLGMVLWYCMYQSGIHATIAGVLFAWMVPVSLLGKYELRFHVPVYFIIMPLFALANTAIALPENSFSALNSPLGWGIIAGLCLGKPLGICAACYLLVKKKWADLPYGVSWHTLAGAGILCGIGFTMSIFISTLAFSDTGQQDISKVAVLTASLIAMIAGIIWLRSVKAPEQVVQPEAE